MRLVAFVCSNGLGHYRRLIGILSRMREMLPNLVLDIACEQWQIDAMQDWPRSRQFWINSKTRLFEGIMAPGVHWAISTQAFGDGRLLNWFERAKQIPDWEQADIILSDNLAAPLSVRSDTILVGSFLWSDVLQMAYPDNSDVRRFATRERELLRAYVPYMLCVEHMTMPSILEYTRAVGFPWMCEEQQVVVHQSALKKRFAVVGGASGIADAFLSSLVRELVDDKDWTIALPQRTIQSNPEFASVENLVIFDFTTAAYAACDFVIARPGMGTVTDCIAQGIPILAVHEPGNSEMAYIGNRINELGIGCYSGISASKNEIVQTMDYLKDLTNLNVLRSNIAKQTRTGLQEAAVWLTNRIVYTCENANHVR